MTADQSDLRESRFPQSPGVHSRFECFETRAFNGPIGPKSGAVSFLKDSENKFDLSGCIRRENRNCD